ncbi:MAG: M23 family metallopeptidase [Caulobacterales bacterium]|nr:M23 family metallopeptidase [Caulobacterales bacterium]
MTRVWLGVSLALALLAGACATDGSSAPIDDRTGGAPPAPPPTFTYRQPGDLEPGSGEGVFDRTVYAPDIVFPVNETTYVNSQVWRPGGSEVGGDQCDIVNFSYPWRDNFCETRSAERSTLNCPRDRVHQGQDLRGGDPALCIAMRNTDPVERTQIPVVAVEDGDISYIGTYTVNLRAGSRIYRYMHLNMERLAVEQGDRVAAGDLIGYLSNDFGGAPTTFHLHLEFKQNIDGVGWTWVNPYMSLVRAYERKLGGPGAAVEAAAPPPVGG